jgi:hypothetical protein
MTAGAPLSESRYAPRADEKENPMTGRGEPARTNGSRRRRLAPWALIFLAAAPAAGDDGTASGEFLSRAWKVPIVDAYAFRDASGWDEGQAIVVAVSNDEFGAEALDRYYDRRHVLDDFFADADTRLVYLEFGLDGSYRGYHYYFEAGDGCGFCGGGARSTVKLAGGRLQGKVAVQAETEDEVAFDITIDVPIAGDDHGEAQGGGGGDPGKAYLVYHGAVEKGDVEAMKRLVSSDQLERWRRAEAAGDGEAFVRYLSENRPHTVTVTEAFLRDDFALVLVEGQSEVLGKMHGEAHLRREGGAWKVADETLQIGSR